MKMGQLRTDRSDEDDNGHLNSRSLEAKRLPLVFVGDLATEALEGQLADEQISTLLVPSEFMDTKGVRTSVISFSLVLVRHSMGVSLEIKLA